MRRGPIILAVAMLVLGAGGLVGVRWSRARERAALIAPALTAMPSLDALRSEGRARLTGALNRARGGDVAALAEASRILHANGFLNEAMRCYAVLERLQPDEPRWPHRHATIAAGFGDLEPALARWQRVTVLAPDYLPARLRLAEVLMKANRPDEAAAAFSEVLRRKPDDPHAALGLARIEVEAKQWAAARARLEKIVAQTDYTLGYDLIVTVYEQLGLAREAAAIRSRTKASGAYRDFNDAWMAELLGDCYDPYQLALAAGAAERSGDAGTAVRLLERAVSLAPEDAAARFQLAGVHTRRRDLPAARAQLERCTSVAPEFADAWAHLSALLEQGGDRAGAERVLAAGLRHCPDSPGLHLMRARQLRKSGSIMPAIEAYRRSLQLRGNEADAHVELATLLFQVERANEAVAQLRRAIEVEPDHPTALTVLALSAISAGDEVSARQWIERIRAQPRVAPTQVHQLLVAYRDRFGRDFR